MLVHRDAERPALVDPEARSIDRILADLCEGRGSARELATEALIELGALEAAVVDRLNPQKDNFGARQAAWRMAGVAAGRLFRASRHDALIAPALAAATRRALERAQATGGPKRVGIRTPQGYAFSALYPEAYLEAARRFLKASVDLPIMVIGLRGIGTSLSAVVQAELEAAGRAVDSLTLRPRGEAGTRVVRLAPELAAALARRAAAGGWFLIVDEGPGESGSSFASAAEALNRIGAGDEQIVLLPSAAREAKSLAAPDAQRRWGLHRKERVGFDELRSWVAPGLDGACDLSAGLWRDIVCDGVRPPVAPQHERRKYLSQDGIRLSKFAGLGRRGRGRLARAEALAEAGYAPEAHGLADGFLSVAFVRGRPLKRRDREAGRLAAAYLGWRGRTTGTGGTTSGDELFAMIEHNVGLALGPDARPRLDGWRRRLRGAARLEVDGRMAPHEWIRTDGAVFKTDAVDHGDDRFLPGPTDLAWDVAGFVVEWGLTEDAAGEFAADVAREAGDPHLVERLAFYETAYLALRTGWTQLSAEAMPQGPDRRGLKRLSARYRAELARAIARMEAQA